LRPGVSIAVNRGRLGTEQRLSPTADVAADGCLVVDIALALDLIPALSENSGRNELAARKSRTRG
jgi:hypothetical protein